MICVFGTTMGDPEVGHQTSIQLAPHEAGHQRVRVPSFLPQYATRTRLSIPVPIHVSLNLLFEVVLITILAFDQNEVCFLWNYETF